jgi:hypothetical protein
MLSGEIVAFNHYHPLEGRSREEGQHLITQKKEITHINLLYYNYSSS